MQRESPSPSSFLADFSYPSSMAFSSSAVDLSPMLSASPGSPLHAPLTPPQFSSGPSFSSWSCPYLDPSVEAAVMQRIQSGDYASSSTPASGAGSSLPDFLLETARTRPISNESSLPARFPCAYVMNQHSASPVTSPARSSLACTATQALPSRQSVTADAAGGRYRRPPPPLRSSLLRRTGSSSEVLGGRGGSSSTSSSASSSPVLIQQGGSRPGGSREPVGICTTLQAAIERAQLPTTGARVVPPPNVDPFGRTRHDGGNRASVIQMSPSTSGRVWIPPPEERPGVSHPTAEPRVVGMMPDPSSTRSRLAIQEYLRGMNRVPRAQVLIPQHESTQSGASGPEMFPGSPVAPSTPPSMSVSEPNPGFPGGPQRYRDRYAHILYHAAENQMNAVSSNAAMYATPVPVMSHRPMFYAVPPGAHYPVPVMSYVTPNEIPSRSLEASVHHFPMPVTSGEAYSAAQPFVPLFSAPEPSRPSRMLSHPYHRRPTAVEERSPAGSPSSRSRAESITTARLEHMHTLMRSQARHLDSMAESAARQYRSQVNLHGEEIAASEVMVRARVSHHERIRSEQMANAEQRRRLIYMPNRATRYDQTFAQNLVHFMDAGAIFMHTDGEPKLILEEDVVAAIACDTQSFKFQNQFPHTEECIICFEEFQLEEDVRVLSCNHTHRFHKHCIDKWLIKNKPNCPICRRILPSLNQPKETQTPATVSDAMFIAGPSQPQPVGLSPMVDFHPLY